MRSLLPLTLLPLLTLAAPPTSPTIYDFKFSGNGCPNDSGSVKATSTTLDDSVSFTFSELSGDNTSNCGIHLQAKGGSAGWQVAVSHIEYKGTVSLKPGSSLDTFTQIFWSETASKTSTLTSELVCHDTAIADAFTLRSTNPPATLNWSKCTGGDGNPGILNVNFRPVVQGNKGSYDVKSATWGLVWRKC
ncbi:hypothetical protein M011DRAFT_474025 [Sporormia fimetaria CBS 119925]|uniref:Ubiquitin 3 binding protein But2 C-terminal domain-containing protein n=1 Tax=Sporormia fimetaria CBS 119925 TaxID=1340428 RepID=A0A6A6VLT6_9PLEO|nr:hypothetical protein M011DRAFT_474025 [Sporormia fimetaria CBS 119925]